MPLIVVVVQQTLRSPQCQERVQARATVNGGNGNGNGNGKGSSQLRATLVVQLNMWKFMVGMGHKNA